MKKKLNFAPQDASFSPINVGDIARDMLASSQFWGAENTPFKATVTPGHGRFLLVTGDNGTGKSLMVEDLRGWGRNHHAVEATISISIRERTGSGAFDPFMKSMIFGQEDEQSTGALSVDVTLRAFNNLQAWSESGRRVLMVLDEPELGLAQSYATPLGELIAKEFLKITSPTACAVVVTHNRELAKEVARHLGEVPSFCYLGQDALTWSQWLGQNQAYSLAELMNLPEMCSDRRRRVMEFNKPAPKTKKK